MGYLNEVATWSASVPYFEADAILTGGPNCPDNIPIQALANRTAFLKKQIDDAVSGALTVMYANRLKTARTITMSGDGTWSVSFDGNGNVTSAMTLASTGVVAGTYPVVTVDAKGRATAGRALQSADLPASPALTGTPTAPTAAAGTSTTQIASTAFVQAAVAALIASSPAALDTLNELAAALGDDPNFATTMTNALAAKAPLASPALTGNPTAPTAAAGTNTTQLANAAFVRAEIGSLTGLSLDPNYRGVGATPAGGDTVTDFNTIVTPGFFAKLLGSTNANKPSGGSGFWYVEVIAYGSTGSVTQIAYPYQTNNASIQMRSRYSGTWTPWVEVYHSGNFDPAAKANLGSPAFTGTPTAPTAAAGNNTTQLATTAFVQAAVAALIASSPAALDTLNELAAALGDDPNFATTMTNALAAKLNSSAYTAADVLAKIRTVDGAASGLDADLLDGQEGAYYLSWGNLTGKPTTLAGYSITVASTAEAAAGADTTKPVTSKGIRDALNATGTAPIYAARAWVNFNGTGTVAIRGSGNVSSITDNGTGDYTVNFTTAMPDANFAVSPGGNGSVDPITGVNCLSSGAKTTTSVRISTTNSTTGRTDFTNVELAVFC